MNKNNYLSIETCKTVRGILALLILFHHISLKVNFGYGIDVLLVKIVKVATAMFFFYSSYGLMLGVKNKPNYLEGFLKKRLSALVIPYFIASLVYGLVLLATGQNELMLAKLLSFRHGGTFLPYSWFIVALIVLYLLFYISFRYVRGTKAGIIICGTLVLLYSIVFCSIGFKYYWYWTVFAFVCGMIYAEYYEKLDYILRSHVLITTVAVVIIYCFCVLICKMFPNQYVQLIFQNFRNILPGVFVLYGSMLISRKYKVLSFYGDISYEFYMYQGIVIELALPLLEKPIVFILLVVIANTCVSYLFNRINNNILSKIRK